MKTVIANASFAFFIGILGMAQANAAPRVETAPQTAVSYSDLDLSREAGAQVMLSRLKAASSVVCGGWPDGRDLGRVMTYRSCTKNAMDAAVAKLGAPKVSALYGYRTERLALRH